MSSELQQQIHQELRELAVGTAYAADANEPDPRYRGYGVRMPAMRALIKKLKPAFRKLDPDERLPLATALIDSGYGEQKTVALELLNSVDKYFTPDKLSELEAIFRKLWGFRT